LTRWAIGGKDGRIVRKRRIASVAFTGAATVAAAGLAAPHAFAANTIWHVSPNGHFKATPVSSTSLHDSTTGQTLTCPVSAASGGGTLLRSATQTGSTPVELGSLSMVNLGNQCHSSFGRAFTVKPNKPVTFGAKSWTGPKSTGVTHGTITGISATITGSLGCTAVVSNISHGAPMSFTYSNANGHFTADPNKNAVLFVKETNSTCPIRQGDKVYFHGVYDVSKAPQISTT
jgi:hypothetical protein